MISGLMRHLEVSASAGHLAALALMLLPVQTGRWGAKGGTGGLRPARTVGARSRSAGASRACGCMMRLANRLARSRCAHTNAAAPLLRRDTNDPVGIGARTSGIPPAAVIGQHHH